VRLSRRWWTQPKLLPRVLQLRRKLQPAIRTSAATTGLRTL